MKGSLVSPNVCLLLCISVGSSFAQSSGAFTDIGVVPCQPNQTTHLTVHTIEARPWPPVLGASIVIQVDATLDKAVKGGSYAVDAWIGFNVPNVAIGQICDFVACPIPAGPWRQNFTADIPAFESLRSVLDGAIVVLTVKATDQDGESVLCNTIATTLTSGGPAPTPDHPHTAPNRTHPPEHGVKARTVLQWSRYINTCDSSDDVAVTEGTNKVIWAMGEDDPATPSTPLKHSQAGQSQLNLLNAAPRTPLSVPTEPHDLTMGSTVSIPSSESTAYVCKPFELPSDRVRWIKRFSVLLEPQNVAEVHHMLVYDCSGLLSSADMASQGTICESSGRQSPFDTCLFTRPPIAGWAVGGDMFTLPEHVGIPIGPGFSTQVVLQIHYDNSRSRAFTDNSGMRMLLTEEKPLFDAGFFLYGHNLFGLEIPAGQDSYEVPSICPGECTQRIVPPGGINVIGGIAHAHTAAIAMKVSLVGANGTEISRMNSNPTYSFNYQQTVLIDPPVLVKPGDSLMLTCTYNTSDRTTTTMGGWGTSEEMCLNYLLYFPRVNYSTHSLRSCSSSSAAIMDASISVDCGDDTEAVLPSFPTIPHPLPPPPDPCLTRDVGPEPSEAVLPSAVAVNYSSFHPDNYTFSAVLAGPPVDKPDDPPDFILYWNVDMASGKIHFAADAATAGWVGFGLSPRGGMTGADVFLGWVQNGMVYYADRMADAMRLPRVDLRQDIESVSGHEVEGIASSASSDSGTKRAALYAVIGFIAVCLVVGSVVYYFRNKRIRHEFHDAPGSGATERGANVEFDTLKEDTVDDDVAEEVGSDSRDDGELDQPQMV